MGGGYNVNAADVIVPTYVNIGGSTENANTYQYQIEGSAQIQSIPVQVPQAGEVKLEINNQTDAERITMALGSTPTAEKNFSVYSGPSNTKRTLSAFVKNACTIYLHIRVSNAAAITVKAYQNEVTMTGGDLQKGKWVSGYADSRVELFYKVKVNTSGLLKLETSQDPEQTPPQIELLNSKKKQIGSGDTGFLTSKNVSYVSVKKGTYYVKMTHNGSYQLRYTFKPVKIKNNGKASKAIQLKKGKTEKGLLIDDNKNNVRYYKITVNKDQKVNLMIDITTSSDNEFGVTQMKTKNITSLKKSFTVKKGKNKKKLKLTKGDNYIVLSGGYAGFSIQWK